jgi:hypothetical protein
MRSFVVVVAAVLAASAAATPSATARPRCSANPKVAAAFIIPPAPFKARLVSVKRLALPPSEPVGRGSAFKRLYEVTFQALVGNAVLPSGHRYSQFAYVSGRTKSAPWCFLKGGSGP